MKLPNGFGTVYKLSGNRRRPWVVKKSIEGRQKAIGYFDTFEHGMAYLLEYNTKKSTVTPYITFENLYYYWKERKFPRLTKASQNGYEISFKHCQRIHKAVFADLRYPDLQAVIDDVKAAGAGYSTQKKVRLLMEQLYSYAIKYDLVRNDYARFVTIDPHVPKYKKRPFTVRERNKLWRALSSVPGVEDVLILIYTGLRVGEYLALTKADVKIRQRCLDIKKSKTASGVRLVPVAKKIWPLVEQKLSKGCIAPCKTYDAFRRVWNKTMKDMNMRHTPHECRHTCASMLDSAGVNDTAIKMILGHARHGITKSVYTHKTLRELRNAVDCI